MLSFILNHQPQIKKLDLSYYLAGNKKDALADYTGAQADLNLYSSHRHKTCFS